MKLFSNGAAQIVRLPATVRFSDFNSLSQRNFQTPYLCFHLLQERLLLQFFFTMRSYICRRRMMRKITKTIELKYLRKCQFYISRVPQDEVKMSLIICTCFYDTFGQRNDYFLHLRKFNLLSFFTNET